MKLVHITGASAAQATSLSFNVESNVKDLEFKFYDLVLDKISDAQYKAMRVNIKLIDNNKGDQVLIDNARFSDLLKIATFKGNPTLVVDDLIAKHYYVKLPIGVSGSLELSPTRYLEVIITGFPETKSFSVHGVSTALKSRIAYEYKTSNLKVNSNLIVQVRRYSFVVFSTVDITEVKKNFVDGSSKSFDVTDIATMIEKERVSIVGVFNTPMKLQDQHLFLNSSSSTTNTLELKVVNDTEITLLKTLRLK